VLEPRAITISALKVRRGDSYLIASGTLNGDTEHLKFTDVRLDTRTSLHLESMRNWIVKTFPKFAQVPPLRGRANAEAKLRQVNEGEPEVAFAFNTEGLYESQFFIDRLNAAGTFKNNTLSMPKFEMTNPGGQIALGGTEIRLPKSRANKDGSAGPPAPTTISTSLEVIRADLHEFLKTLGLNEKVPVFLDVKAKTPRLKMLLSYLKKCQKESFVKVLTWLLILGLIRENLSKQCEVRLYCRKVRAVAFVLPFSLLQFMQMLLLKQVLI
jgi:hypothetical protein